MYKTINRHWRSKGGGASGAVAPGGSFWGAALLEFCEKCAATNPISKCLDFAQKRCQNARNAISETQISKGGMAPDLPSWTRLVNRLATPVFMEIVES